MTRRAVDILWYATFYVIALGAGWAIASTNAGEQMVAMGLGAAVIVGPVLAQLSKLARKLSVDKHSVRVELDDFRFTWIWTTIWFGGALIGAWAVMDQVFYTYNVQASILALGTGGLLVGAWFARVAGRKREYLRVDLAAGVAEYCGWGKTLACPLGELGRFEIQTYRRVNNSSRGRTSEDWHRLTVPGFPDREITDSVYPGGVRRLQARLQRQLDDLRDVSAVRRVLAETPTDGSTYRAGIGLEDAVKAAVEDPARRAAALRFLERDREGEIAARARSLRT